MKNKGKSKKAIGIVFAVILAVSVFTVALPSTASESNVAEENANFSPDFQAKSSVGNAKFNLNDAQKKLSTDLLQLLDSSYLPEGQDGEALEMQMETLKQFRPAGSLSPTGDGSVTDDLVYVYVYLESPAETETIAPYVWEITDRDEANHLAVAWVEVNELETLASMEAVRTIRTVMPPLVRTGSVTTEGDAIHRTADVRATYSQSGLGMKVGIISDGVNHWTDARDSGDLPASLTVLSDTVGGDEGTAMLEIVHDMVPGAALYFHDCGDNTVAFNAAIDALVAAGCDVVCDDISWTTEPFFEDGIIASHLTTVLAGNDIIYASSAGNRGDKHYQGDYYNDGYDFHDFSRGTEPTDKYLYVSIPNNGEVTVILQWNDQFGASSNDYDLYLFDTSDWSTLAQSTDTQDGGDDPLEAFSYTNTGGSTIDAEIDVYNYNGLAATKTLEVYIYTSNGASVYTDNIDPVDSIFGHPAVPDVIAVGAIAASDPGNDDIEPFSSQGPVTISYPSPVTRAKSDLSGIDGVTVTGAGGFPSPFYGTSAAAPHIAAIAAQLWGADPSKTGDDIRNCLYSTAVDLGDPGYDYVYGYGRADAFEAYKCLCPDNETGDFVDVLSVDASNFTKIWVYVSVNTTEGRAGNLTESDFEVYEDGVEQTIESFYAAGAGENVTTNADILFVFDDTGSMGAEIGGMKAKCKELTDSIEAAGIDARYALVSFKDAPELDQGWTSDATTFNSAIDALSASGGGDDPEDDLDALELGLGLGFRAGTQKVVIDITDAPTHYKGDGSSYSNYTMSEVATDLISSGVAYIAVSPDASADNEKKTLAGNVGGLWIDIHGGNFSEILDRIVGVITTAYHIDYTTTNPAHDCTNRTVEVVVHDPVVGNDSDTGKYISPCEEGGTVVSIPNAAASHGGTVTVPISITNVTNLATANIWLHYDKDVVIVDSVSAGDLGSITVGIDNTNGVTKMNWFSATGQTGNFVFAYVTLNATGSEGETSPLDLDVKELGDAGANPITHTVKDGVFTVGVPLMEGDVTMDKHVTMADAMFIAQYMAGLRDLNADQLKCADTTDEGVVSMADAMHIAQWKADPDGSLGVLFKPLWASPADDDMQPPVDS